MKRIILTVFVIVSLGEVASRMASLETLQWICKPMIMLSLGGYYLLQTRNRSAVVLLAILFSLVGDVALIFESINPRYFMGGLLAFMIAHIAYIMAYRKHRYEPQEEGVQGIQKIRFAFPIILAGSGLVVILYPTLGALRLPVIVYAFVLVLMVLNALFRYGRTSARSFWMVFGGAILFMISDSILALDKFLTPISHAGIMIMVSYATAQFLLVQGLSEHPDG